MFLVRLSINSKKKSFNARQMAGNRIINLCGGMFLWEPQKHAPGTSTAQGLCAFTNYFSVSFSKKKIRNASKELNAVKVD